MDVGIGALLGGIVTVLVVVSVLYFTRDKPGDLIRTARKLADKHVKRERKDADDVLRNASDNAAAKVKREHAAIDRGSEVQDAAQAWLDHYNELEKDQDT